MKDVQKVYSKPKGSREIADKKIEECRLIQSLTDLYVRSPIGIEQKFITNVFQIQVRERERVKRTMYLKRIMYLGIEWDQIFHRHSKRKWLDNP